MGMYESLPVPRQLGGKECEIWDPNTADRTVDSMEDEEPEDLLQTNLMEESGIQWRGSSQVQRRVKGLGQLKDDDTEI